jgi:hypothetical protein
MQNILIKKLMVFAIIILFIFSVVTSNAYKLGNEKGENNLKIENFKVSPSINTTIYAFIDIGPSGTGFYALGPNNLIRFNKWNKEDFISGGTWTKDCKFICCTYENGSIYDIHPKTLEASYIGVGGVGLNGLAYDPVNDTLFGASGTDLYEIDISTGEQIHIGDFGISSTIIAIACDKNGTMYAWDVKFSGDSYLYTVNTNTGEATVVGSMGATLLYAQDGTFDLETDILYLSAFVYSPVYGSFWCVVDKETGELTIGSGCDGDNPTALAIGYELNSSTPVTNISVNPEDPDGENGWYKGNVTLSFNATDNYGVIATFYRINGGKWKTYEFPITISDEGENFIEYYSIDYAGYKEEIKISQIKIDKSKPEIDLYWEAYEEDGMWWIIFTAEAIDEISGMNRVEFYINDILESFIEGAGPMYYWEVPIILLNYSVNGFICNKKIIGDNISFFALIVWTDTDYSFKYWEDIIKAIAYDNAGWSAECYILPGIPPYKPPFIMKRLTFENDYVGYIGQFLIFATFKSGPQ